jgi:uncharacterized membrane protein
MNPAQRVLSIDVARGIIMIAMALDHAVSPWVVNYHLPEIVLAGVPDFLAFHGYPDGWRQLTRLLTHICAPGFQLFAGMGLAISVCRALAAARPQWRISLDMILRGLVLIGLEFAVMSWAYQAPFLFLVLCCIGSSIILFSVLRFLPPFLLLAGALAVLIFQPWYGPAAIVQPSGRDYLLNIWTRIAFHVPEAGVDLNGPPWWQVMYPILPWVGCFGVGWCLGTWAARHSGFGNSDRGLEPSAGLRATPPLQYSSANRGNRAVAREQAACRHPPSAIRNGTCLLVAFGLALAALGVILRWQAGAFGDRLGGAAAPWTAEFWTFSKYPPSPAFSCIFLGLDVLLVGLLWPLDRARLPSVLWQIPNVFGRVALFFFIVHFWLYALSWFFFVGPARLLATPRAQWSDYQFPLIVGYGVWIMGLVLLWPVCWAYDKLRQRYRTVLRYF